MWRHQQLSVGVASGIMATASAIKSKKKENGKQHQ